MTELAQLLVAMLDELSIADGDLVISELELELPIEARLAKGRLQASWPRGRLETGFDPPLATLAVHLALEETA